MPNTNYEILQKTIPHSTKNKKSQDERQDLLSVTVYQNELIMFDRVERSRLGTPARRRHFKIRGAVYGKTSRWTSFRGLHWRERHRRAKKTPLNIYGPYLFIVFCKGPYGVFLNGVL